MAQKKLVKHLRIGDLMYVVNSNAEIGQEIITSISKHDTRGIHMGNSKSEDRFTDIEKKNSFKMYYGGIAFVSMNDAIAAAKTDIHNHIAQVNKEIEAKTIKVNELLVQLNEYPKM